MLLRASSGCQSSGDDTFCGVNGFDSESQSIWGLYFDSILDGTGADFITEESFVDSPSFSIICDVEFCSEELYGGCLEQDESEDDQLITEFKSGDIVVNADFGSGDNWFELDHCFSFKRVSGIQLVAIR